MTEEERKRRNKVEDYVRSFKSRLSKKYGIHAIVVYNYTPKLKGPLELYELEEICNKYVDMILHPGGIKSRSRLSHVVIYRQIFMYIASKMGYSSTYIGRYLNYDHATVIHARKAISSLLEINDRKIVLAFKKVENGIKETIGNKQPV